MRSFGRFWFETYVCRVIKKLCRVSQNFSSGFHKIEYHTPKLNKRGIHFFLSWTTFSEVFQFIFKLCLLNVSEALLSRKSLTRWVEKSINLYFIQFIGIFSSKSFLQVGNLINFKNISTSLFILIIKYFNTGSIVRTLNFTHYRLEKNFPIL